MVSATALGPMVGSPPVPPSIPPAFRGMHVEVAPSEGAIALNCSCQTEYTCTFLTERGQLTTYVPTRSSKTTLRFLCGAVRVVHQKCYSYCRTDMYGTRRPPVGDAITRFRLPRLSPQPADSPTVRRLRCDVKSFQEQRKLETPCSNCPSLPLS